MQTGREINYKDRLYNREMGELGLSATARMRQSLQVYRNYGNIAIDAFFDNSGIGSGTNYTYEGASDYDVKLTGGQQIGTFQSVAFVFPTVPEVLGVAVMLNADIDGNPPNITVYLSRDNGVRFMKCPLTKIGDTGMYMSTEMIDVGSCASGSNVKYRIDFKESTVVKIKGIAVFGR